MSSHDTKCESSNGAHDKSKLKGTFIGVDDALRIFRALGSPPKGDVVTMIKLVVAAQAAHDAMEDLMDFGMPFEDPTNPVHEEMQMLREVLAVFK